MTLVEVFEVIQLAVLRKIRKVLRAGNYRTIEEWKEAKEKQYDEINQFLLGLLLLNKNRIHQIINRTADLAYQEIADHIDEQWGDGFVAGWETYLEDDAIYFINLFVLSQMLSTDKRTGALEKQYRETIDTIAEQKQIADQTETHQVIDDVMLTIFALGLASGYIDRAGHRWALDRYVQSVEHHLSYGIWQSVLEKSLDERSEELVSIPVLSDPRPACAGLQNGKGGIICIIPRTQASSNAQSYPNIYDPSHKYLQMGGHHGTDGNCRHIWSAVDGTSSNLYQRIDDERLKMKKIREQRRALLKN